VNTPRVEAPGEIKNAKIEGYDPDRKVIFVSDPQWAVWGFGSVPMSVDQGPAVLDAEGRPIPFTKWSDLKGKSVDVLYAPGAAQGSIKANQVTVTER
jgi:hypothetical protein